MLGTSVKSKRRAGIGPRREARARTLSVLRQPRVWTSALVATGLVPVFVFAVTGAQDAWFGNAVDPLLTGVLLGAGLASVPWALWTFALSMDGSVSWRIGADAERWTANELDRLGDSWHVEHNVPFPENGIPLDVDHIAIGPYGVLAVETKWTSSHIDLGARHLEKEVKKAAKQAEDNAGRVRGLLMRVADIDVIPMVVFWGPHVTAAATPVQYEGKVRIVAGDQADLWRPRLANQRLKPEILPSLSARVHTWLVEQEQKSIGATVEHRLRKARRLSLASMAVTGVLIALFPFTQIWVDLDRVLGAVFRFAGGAIGAGVFISPLVLALAALALVHLARRLDPTISYWRGMASPLLWCACFLALALIAA